MRRENWDATTWDDDVLARRVGLARLAVGFLFALGVAGVLGALPTVLVVMTVLFMIVLHEFGHFAAAKLAGVKVTEFFVGFGQRIWSVRRGETEYGIKVWPLGGYCRIPGMTMLEDIDPTDEARTYRRQPFPQRFAISFAGVATHFVLAFVLLFILHGIVGIIRYDKPLPEVGEITRIAGEVSPAQRAGFEVGDRLRSVDGRRLARWEDLPPYIRARPGQNIEFEIERAGAMIVLRAVPLDLSEVKVEGRPASEPTGFVGIGPAYPTERSNPVVAIGRSSRDLARTSGLVLSAIADLVSFNGIRAYTEQLFERGPSAPTSDTPRLLSPIGLVHVAGQAADEGLETVLILLLSINVFVGFANLIPLLPLDGGHIAIAIYEAIRSRGGKRYHADVAKLIPAAVAVLAVLAFLGITALWLDIVRPVSIQ